MQPITQSMANFLQKKLLPGTIALLFGCGFFIFGPLVQAASPASVDLGSAGSYVILSKAGISTTAGSVVVGNIGVSPAAATYVTGFGLILPAQSAFSTSALITGNIYASDYANPTSANLTTAVLDMQTAYTDAASRPAGVTELGAGNIGGLTIIPGTYKWGTGVIIPTDVTLSGGANDIWIFQIAQNLELSSGVRINLSGGAQAKNIFWQVAGQTTIGTTAVFNGNILDQTAIVLNTGAVLNGRALAQTAVTLDASVVTIPAGTIPAVPATPAVPIVSPAIPATPAVPVINPGTAVDPIACTMDVKQCADGSYVGRTGSKCEFVCPIVKTATGLGIFKFQSAGNGPVDFKIYNNGTLLRGSNSVVYLIVRGEKYRIKNLAELHEYRGKEIIKVADSVLEKYSTTFFK